ncbi:hypothetical protein OPT61_g4787 [Boeremia exigua]|uniref:Uncharacterized protein n=1 Tax=Boeremia exigua TaxID=749465 RepID=A0ACC2ID00_9PLEO|nr:hypothetical protein OPT61_g4787 [Boeremia exigua]
MAGEDSTTKKKTTGHMAEYVHEGTVIIRVGPEGVPYHVHKALLRHHSEYFTRALNGNWKEAEENLITLDDVDCSTFDTFVHWIYTQRRPERYTDWAGDHPSGVSKRLRAFEMGLAFETGLALEMGLVEACVFADRFVVPAFGRMVAHLFLHYLVTEAAAAVEVVAYAYEHLPEGHPVLEAMMDSYCSLIWDDDSGDLSHYHYQILPQRFQDTLEAKLGL